MNGSPHCSFCEKGVEQVATLVSGGKVFICEECVEVCVGIIDKQKHARVEYASWITLLGESKRVTQ